MKSVLFNCFVLSFALLGVFSVVQAQDYAAPASNPVCSRNVQDAVYCAAFERLDEQLYEVYFRNSEACEDFCNDTTCKSTPECINLAIEDSGTTPQGQACFNAQNYCRARSEDNCQALNNGTREVNCEYVENSDQCIPSRGECGSYCYSEVDWQNEVVCRDSRDECIIELLDENPEPGDLRFPACGCDQSNVSVEQANGGCGLRVGTSASEWREGIGDDNQSLFGSPIDASFELDGFKPFEDVRVGDNELYGDNNLPGFINTFLSFVIGLSGAIVVVMIVVGGFQYVLAAAAPVKNDAKDKIRDALIGLGLLLGSVALLNTINPQLLNLAGLRPVEITITEREFQGDTDVLLGLGGANYGSDAVQKAIYEYEANWASGTKKEDDESQYSILNTYWESIGWNESQWSPSGTAWSAAFISYVTGLRASAHWQYINAAYDDRKNGWAFCEPNEHVPQPGDLVCRTRAGGSFTPQGSYTSHCDLVVSNNGTSIEYIGGNVSNSSSEGRGVTVNKKSRSLSAGKTPSFFNIGALVPPGKNCSG